MTGIVTPEAVRLDFADAGIGSRTVALLVDALLLFVTLTVVSIGAAAMFGLAQVPGWVAVSTLLVLNFLLLFGYPIVCEVAFSGRSVGKWALGLRVVTREGAPVGFRHAAIRSAFMLIDFFATFGAAAVLSAALTQRSQRLGDLVAGTVVLRQRHARGSSKAAAFALPPGTQGYAATISPTVLSAAEYERVRAFLLRAPELHPQARQTVAESLATPLLGRVPPPDGMDAATFLQVVAAVYQRGHQPERTSQARPSSPGSGAATPYSPHPGFKAPE